LKALSVLYLIRVFLGVASAALCAVFRFTSLIDGLWLSLTVYIITYYILRQLFIEKVKEARTVATTGIGAFFLTWIVTWVLLLTIQLS